MYTVVDIMHYVYPKLEEATRLTKRNLGSGSEKQDENCDWLNQP